MLSKRSLLSIFILLLALVSAFWFLNNAKSPISISTARATMTDGGMYAVFLNMKNEGGPDVLSGVSSHHAERVFIMGGTKDYPLAIPAGSSADLAADGAHIMISVDDHHLPEGGFIPLTLKFQSAGDVHVKAKVSGMAMQGAMKSTDGEGDVSGDAGEESEAGNMGMDHSMHLMGAGSLVNVEEPELQPALSLQINKHGANEWRVVTTTQNFQFMEPKDPLTHKMGFGHAHLYLNNLKIQRMYSAETVIGALPPGKHAVSVTLNTNDHKGYAIAGVPVSAQIEIEVQ